MEFLQNIGTNHPPVEEAEVKVDLRGMEKEPALEKLDHVVKYCKRSSSKTLYVTFDPVRPGAGETLFQPVARYFKFEKYNGYIVNAVPVMRDDSGGFLVTFKL